MLCFYKCMCNAENGLINLSAAGGKASADCRRAQQIGSAAAAAGQCTGGIHFCPSEISKSKDLVFCTYVHIYPAPLLPFFTTPPSQTKIQTYTLFLGILQAREVALSNTQLQSLSSSPCFLLTGSAITLSPATSLRRPIHGLFCRADSISWPTTNKRTKRKINHS